MLRADWEAEVNWRIILSDRHAKAGMVTASQWPGSGRYPPLDEVDSPHLWGSHGEECTCGIVFWGRRPDVSDMVTCYATWGLGQPRWTTCDSCVKHIVRWWCLTGMAEDEEVFKGDHVQVLSVTGLDSGIKTINKRIDQWQSWGRRGAGGVWQGRMWDAR